MTARLLDGEALASRIRAEVTDRVARLRDAGVHVGLGTFLVGDDGPSARYVAMKHADCAEVGIHSAHVHLPADVSQAELLDTVRVVNHDARDHSAMRWVGRLGAGVPVWLSAEWLAADFRITTGFVEPHFFAGFSGGPKLVAPGLAGLETVLALHDAARIGHPRATWGVTKGNPVHDDVRAIAAEDAPHVHWFGQTMGGPQFLAFLVQADTWMRSYHVRLVDA